MCMASKFVEIYDEWITSQGEETNPQYFLSFHEFVELHYPDQISWFAFWHVQPDQRMAFDFSIMDFKDGSFAIRRNQSDESHRWRVAA